jgi:hypothetical protein
VWGEVGILLDVGNHDLSPQVGGSATSGAGVPAVGEVRKEVSVEPVLGRDSQPAAQRMGELDVPEAPVREGDRFLQHPVEKPRILDRRRAVDRSEQPSNRVGFVPRKPQPRCPLLSTRSRLSRTTSSERGRRASKRSLGAKNQIEPSWAARQTVRNDGRLISLDQT